MDKGSKIFVFIIISLFIGIMAYVSYNKSKLGKEGVVVPVTIVGCNLGIKSINTLTCEFTYNDKQYRISTGSSVSVRKWKRLIGETVPAMYGPQSGLLELLILPDDFDKFNLPYPDTLAKWAKGRILYH